MWNGDYVYLLRAMVAKDFKIRYRNMSLGVFWSLLNPLVMMAVLTFVFTRIFPNPAVADFAVFLLCGLVPFNFFATAWHSGTLSLIGNAGLIKRLPVPREMVPIASVLSSCLHLGMQLVLLLAAVLLFGKGITLQWLWLPVLWGLEILFLCGLALLFSALAVYVRDTLYVVESVNHVMFWLVPIFYPFSVIPQEYRNVYQFNPVAALVLASRNVLLDGTAPLTSTLLKLTLSSLVMLAAGWMVFQRLKRHFYNYL